MFRFFNSLLFFCAISVLPALAHGQQFTVLHSFAGGASDGFNPENGLAVSGSTIYGVTIGGGSSNVGTIYSLGTGGGPITLVHSFSSSNGDFPYAGVTLSGSGLYGTTQSAGPNGGGGTVYSVSTSGSGFRVLHAFSVGTSDGQNPEGVLAFSGTTLYGTTTSGGSSNLGTVFSVGSGYSLLHSFVGGTADGSSPSGSSGAAAGVVLSGTTLFGTSGGGAFGDGTVYSESTSGGPTTLLHSFAGGSDGSSPRDVILGGSTLYGTTNSGGASGGGTVFSINTDGSGYHILFSFNGTGGSGSQAGLDLVGSTLYGTTSSGGANGDGVIFRINTDGGGYRVVHSFASSDGSGPGTLASSGSTLYGEMFSGGTNNLGTVFSMTLPASTTFNLSANAASKSVLLNGQTTVSSSITNSGSSSADSLDFTGLGATSAANGTVSGSAISGGPVTNSSGSASNTGLTFTGTGFSNGVVVTPVVATVANDISPGNASSTNSAAVTIVVGNATADKSNNTNQFGTPLTGVVASGRSYAGLESMVVGTTGSGGGPVLDSAATILAGINSGTYTGNGSATVSMSWRTRTLQETPVSQGGTPKSPPLPHAFSPLISDVLNLSGMSNSANEPAPSDVFALQMTYDPALLSNEAAQAASGAIYLAWLNPTAGLGGVPLWQNAILGDTGNNAAFAEQGFLGSFTTFQTDFNDTNLADYVGAWGVDIANHDVWAVVNHNSEFAVVPEPSSLLLAGIGVVGLLIVATKRRAGASNAINMKAAPPQSTSS